MEILALAPDFTQDDIDKTSFFFFFLLSIAAFHIPELFYTDFDWELTEIRDRQKSKFQVALGNYMIKVKSLG